MAAYQSLILKADGSLHSSGNNGKGQLGDGTTIEKSSYTEIFPLGLLKFQVYHHSNSQNRWDGGLYGDNTEGQLGAGQPTQKPHL